MYTSIYDDELTFTGHANSISVIKIKKGIWRLHIKIKIDKLAELIFSY